MKNKNTAAFLAFVAGFAGTHQFYLGNVAAGMLFIFLLCIKFKFAFLLAIIQGIIYLTKSDEDFNQKYNYSQRNNWNPQRNDYESAQRERDEQYRRDEQRRQAERTQQQNNKWDSWNMRTDNSPFKKEGIEKYKEFDFKGAIVAFEKALVSEPVDVSTLFNLACCHAHLENKDAAFDFLHRAIRGGLKDVEKIKTHDGLAFLRVQPEWEETLKMLER